MEHRTMDKNTAPTDIVPFKDKDYDEVEAEFHLIGCRLGSIAVDPFWDDHGHDGLLPTLRRLLEPVAAHQAGPAPWANRRLVAVALGAAEASVRSEAFDRLCDRARRLGATAKLKAEADRAEAEAEAKAFREDQYWSDYDTSSHGPLLGRHARRARMARCGRIADAERRDAALRAIADELREMAFVLGLAARRDPVDLAAMKALLPGDIDRSAKARDWEAVLEKINRLAGDLLVDLRAWQPDLMAELGEAELSRRVELRLRGRPSEDPPAPAGPRPRRDDRLGWGPSDN
jgi:hypothetical protein